MKKFLSSPIFYQFSTSQASKSVGFIGLGNMGSGMARNLKAGNFNVKAFDVMPETRSQFKSEGFEVVENI